MAYPETTEGTKDYPYWKNEFDREFKDFEIWYCEGRLIERLADKADAYRVFMIYCNNNQSETKSRMDCLNELKQYTFEKPLKMGNEFFWTEPVK